MCWEIITGNYLKGAGAHLWLLGIGKMQIPRIQDVEDSTSPWDATSDGPIDTYTNKDIRIC